MEELRDGRAREIPLLLVEDSVLDGELILERLRDEGYEVRALRVENRSEMERAITDASYKLILSDFSLPNFDGFSALELAKERCPDVPFIFVSGAIGEERALETLRRGATDYVLKDRLDRLAPAVSRALLEAENRRELRRAAERTDRLQRLAKELISVVTPVDAAVLAVRQSMAALNCGMGGCWLVSEDEPVLELLVCEGYPADICRTGGRIACDSSMLLARARDAPMWIESFAQSSLHASHEGTDIMAAYPAAAIVPLAIEGSTLGVLGLSFDHERPFEAEEKALVTAIARQTAQALDRARVYAREREARERLTLLARASNLLGQSLDPEETLETIATFSMPLLGDACVLDVVDPAGHVRRIVRAYENSALQEALATHADFHATPVVLGERLLELDGGACGLGSRISVPLQSSGKKLGVLTLFYGPSRRRHKEAHVHLAEELANRASLALVNAELYRESREAERRFHAVFDHALDAMFVADDEGRIVDANPAACQLTQRSRDELLTQRSVDLVVTDAPTRGAELWRQFLEHSVQLGEIRMRRADGTVFDAEYSATASFLPGRHLSVVRDITPRKRAEEALGFLGEASLILGGSLDYEATLTSVVRLSVRTIADIAAIHLVEPDGSIRCLVRAETLSFESSPALVPAPPPANRDMFRPVEVIRLGKPEVMYEVSEGVTRAQDAESARFLREMRVRSLLCVPVFARGKVCAAITIALCVGRNYSASDLRLAEELARRAGTAIENAQLYHEVQEASRLKDDFLATISHELRTPMTAILGWASILKSNTQSPDRLARGLEVIERNAKIQARLIDDVLDVSRIINGKLSLDPAPTDIAALVRAAVDSVAPLALTKSVQLSTSVSADVGQAFVDPSRLQQVVWNLASNAVKFTPSGGHVTVGAKRTNGEIHIEVADTGQGIRADFLPHVFERFRQADSSSMRSHGGLGLGLAIALHLVELHGGTLTAESSGEGRGSRFTVRLPRQGEQSEGNQRASMGSMPAQARALGSVRVVVCDDEPDTRELLQEVLEGEGAEVVLASSAAEALSLIEQDRPDVLVSDLGMPDEDGYALIAKVRALGGEGLGRIPAVALTAYARPEDMKRAHAAGFDRHVVKPIEPRELVEVIATLVREGTGLRTSAVSDRAARGARTLVP